MTAPLDSLSLVALAGAMRDGTWLDLRTEDGPICRVRIVEIVVRTRADDVRLRQHWLKDDELQKHEFCVDAEAIWRADPSTTPLDAVRPHGVSLPAPPSAGERVGEVLVAICAAESGVAAEDIRLPSGNSAAIHQRHIVILGLYEMTDMADREICGFFKYSSPTPLYSARDKASLTRCGYMTDAAHKQRMLNVVKGFRKTVQQAVVKADIQFGLEHRTTRAFPKDYTPIVATR